MLDLNSGSIKLDHEIEKGSRPLAISYIQDVPNFDDGACYGEYWENKHRSPVSIWVRRDTNSWQVAYTFPQGAIEHIHAVISDKRRGLVWILTGDYEKSAGIWAARNNFKDVSPVLVGSQESRCCWIAFWRDRIIYATDSHLIPNSLRELFCADVLGGSRSEPLIDTAGSSIYSCMVQDQIVFSTSVEPGPPSGMMVRDLLARKPGPGIRDDYSYLMAGNPELGFSVIGAWRKDKLPPRLCEFGAIKFPTGLNPGNYLYAYFTGLSGCDGSMRVYELLV